MATIVRVGAVACPAIVNGLEQNVNTIIKWTEIAAKSQVDLLLFPELSITGYDVTKGVLPPITGGSRAFQVLAGLAQKTKITIAAGMAWRQDDGGPYLAHGLWQPTGEFSFYCKTHLGQREQVAFLPGNNLPVFRLANVTVGIQMCLEHHFPEISQTLVLRGAQLLLCPHAVPRLTPSERRERWHISLRARAYDNCTYVLAANQVGNNGRGIEYPGGTMLIGPTGDIIAEDFSGTASLLTAAIDLDDIIKVRTTSQGKCRRFYAESRRPELYE